VEAPGPCPRVVCGQVFATGSSSFADHDGAEAGRRPLVLAQQEVRRLVCVLPGTGSGMALEPFPRELLIRQARAQEVVPLRSVLVFLVFGGLLSLSYPGRHGLNRVRWSRVHLPLLGRGPIIAVRCVVVVGACCTIIRSIYTLNHGQTACRLSLSPVTRCVCVCVWRAGAVKLIYVNSPPIGLPPICCALIPPGGIPIPMPVGTRGKGGGDHMYYKNID
jgi:hypothetical protein